MRATALALAVVLGLVPLLAGPAAAGTAAADAADGAGTPTADVPGADDPGLPGPAADGTSSDGPDDDGGADGGGPGADPPGDETPQGRDDGDGGEGVGGPDGGDPGLPEATGQRSDDPADPAPVPKGFDDGGTAAGTDGAGATMDPTGPAEAAGPLLDAVRDHPAAAAAAAATTGGLAVGLWAFLWLRGRRVADPMDHPVRRHLVRRVRARPGRSVGELADLVGVDPSTVRYHLDVLEAAGRVRTVRRGRHRLAFPADGGGAAGDGAAGGGAAGDGATGQEAALVKDPVRRRILAWLLDRRRIAQSRLRRDLGLAASTVSHHARRLREAGLVEAERSGREVLLSLVPERRGEVRAWLRG